MFVVEESQLLEDIINDRDVRKLYDTLKKHENSNNRDPLIEEILGSEKCRALLYHTTVFHKDNGHSLENPEHSDKKITLEQREKLLQTLDLKVGDVAALALVVSATCTQLFVIDNFVGPSNDLTLVTSYRNIHTTFKHMSQEITYKSLSCDASDAYHLVTNPWLLKMSQVCWMVLRSLGCSSRLLELEFLVWKHRYLTVHLMILLEPAESIMTELRKIQEYIFDHHVIASEGGIRENTTQMTRFNVVNLCCELIQSALLRDGFTFCRKFFDYSSQISGLEIEHTGVLGKRTRYQHKDVPQLVIRVNEAKKEHIEKVPKIEASTKVELPRDIELDDDTLLPDISFVAQDGDGPERSVTEQTLNIQSQLLMLTKLDMILKTEVMEESLKDEWTLAYVRSITKSATVWTTKYKALAIRSVCEKKHMRKLDRALLQMDELIKTHYHKASEDDTQRMRMFYSVLPLSRWQLKRSLGDISLDLALFKNALDVYSTIEYWEGIIKCYCALGQTVKAEKIIKQELEKSESPYLYCLLGDVTDNLEFYEKSWEVSKKRFARAKKAIGTYHYVRKDYEKAVENYRLALNASPSNVSILSLLAYSCLILERYDEAAEHYRNLTYLDDSNFLAWNNLSKAYIKLDQKERAWHTLKQTIRCNYEEWKVWENFMLVSIQIGALDDVLLAWHRLIDLKSSHKDDQILSALTQTLLNPSKEELDDSSKYTKLVKDALKLIARLNSTSECSSRYWICYFRLLVKEFELSKSQNQSEMSKLDVDSRLSKITNALQRATPVSLKLEADWYRHYDKINNVLDGYDELIECFLHVLNTVGPRPETFKQWKYFKLSATNLIKTLERIGL